MGKKKTTRKKRNERWLVAAWPGMGDVAVTAAVYLLSMLKMRQIAEFDARDLFEMEEADVTDGLVRAARLPQSRLFLAEDVAPGRDLIVFLGEAQPPTGKYALCARLLDVARSLRVTRVFSFAAWAAGTEMTGPSNAHGIATDEAGLRDLRAHGVVPVANGRISGLNGALLAAAAEQKMPGIGLLGEMPLMALQIAYPNASAAVLRVFCSMAGIKLDLGELERHGRQTQEQLASAYQQALRALGDAGAGDGEMEEEPRPRPARPSEPAPEAPHEESGRIEELFRQAAEDRAKAFELKRELDRLGVFSRYEDRFLALFKEK
jgi:proteasome assembly chaperone (PAC2) family protein